MNFDADAFISYAHLDNLELIEGHHGWVTNLHRALEKRVAQFLGKLPRIWRDPKLQGNDLFAETIIERLRRVAVLVVVVSPRYVKSEWTRKELSEFWRAAQEQGGVRLHDKARIFKVLKTRVPVELHPPELQHMLGYEFFKVDLETGREHELDDIFGPQAQRDFWLRLDDLAHDICGLLEELECPETLGSSEDVYLAETTMDLKEELEIIRRDLQQHGYTVRPTRQLSSVASEVKLTVAEELAQCQLSIHLVGKNYSLVPEGSTESLLEIQNELAIERGKKGGFSRLLWIPPGLQAEDLRQRQVVENLRMDPRISGGDDLLETFLEDLKTVIHGRLKRTQDLGRVPAAPTAAVGDLRRIYLIYDQRDAELVCPWVDYLYEQNLEVLRPVFEGDEAEIREYHNENLRTCDGALIFYGSANECWLRRKLGELQKSPGYGRTKPAPIIGISLVAPRNLNKEHFRTHEAMVIPQFNGFSPDPLREFVSGLQE